MIPITENTSFIAQHQLALSLLCLIVFSLAISTLIFGFLQGSQEKQFIKHSKAILPISIGALIISICLILTISAKGPHYTGSAEYTVDNVKLDSEGDQVLVIDDGKRNVELKVDGNDKESYSRGDKVRIKVTDPGSSLSKGKHHLSDTLSQKHNSFSSKVINVTYEIEKVK